MLDHQKHILKNYLVNIQLNMSVAAFTKVPESWRDLNFISDFNRFYFIVDGEGFVKIGDEEYYPNPGQLFILPAGLLQSYSTISTHTFLKYWCHFTAKIGNVDLFRILDVSHFVDVKDADRLVALFQKLIAHYRSDDITATLGVQSVLFELLACYIENVPIDQIRLRQSASIEKINLVLKYIESNLSKEITVAELAELLHLHPNYFIRFFKTMLDISPIQYINRTRTERAKQLLISTNKSISEIAELVGLDLFYFSRMFKTYTGFSPTEFRSVVTRRD